MKGSLCLRVTPVAHAAMHVLSCEQTKVSVPSQRSSTRKAAQMMIHWLGISAACTSYALKAVYRDRQPALDHSTRSRVFHFPPVSSRMATKSTTATESIDHASDPDRINQQPGLAHTSTNISLSPELFEKLYLAPKVPHAAENVGKFANATPLGFLGYAIISASLTRANMR